MNTQELMIAAHALRVCAENGEELEVNFGNKWRTIKGEELNALRLKQKPDVAAMVQRFRDSYKQEGGENFSKEDAERIVRHIIGENEE